MTKLWIKILVTVCVTFTALFLMSTLIKYSEEDDEIKELTNSVEIYSDALDVMINEAKTYTKCAEA